MIKLLSIITLNGITQRTRECECTARNDADEMIIHALVN